MPQREPCDLGEICSAFENTLRIFAAMFTTSSFSKSLVLSRACVLLPIPTGRSGIWQGFTLSHAQSSSSAEPSETKATLLDSWDVDSFFLSGTEVRLNEGRVKCCADFLEGVKDSSGILPLEETRLRMPIFENTRLRPFNNPTCPSEDRLDLMLIWEKELFTDIRKNLKRQFMGCDYLSTSQTSISKVLGLWIYTNRPSRLWKSLIGQRAKT